MKQKHAEGKSVKPSADPSTLPPSGVAGQAPSAGQALRQRAEAQLREQPADRDKIAPEEARRLLHELQVHQIELEMQNEELRRAQVEIETSRAKYVDLFDFAPVGYLTLSETGIVLEANLTAANLLGVERSQLVKKPVTCFIVREDQDIYYLHRKQLFETRARQVCELRMVRKGGVPFLVHIEGIAAQGDDDALVCRATLSDITERKRAEERLQKTEQDYRILTENSPDLIARFDTRLRHLYVNPAAARAGKLSASEYIGLTIAESGVPEPVATTWDQRIRQVLRTGKMMDVEDAFPTPEGIRYFHARLVPELTPDGSVCSVLSVARDITERKRAEEALRESEARLRVIFEHANDAIHLDAADDQILQVNPRMCELMGYSREELLRLRVSDLQAPEVRGQPGNVVRNELARHGSTVFEGLNLHCSGRRVPVEISVARIESAQGDLSVSIVRDITERKRAEAQLAEQIDELRRWHKATLDRETRILDLKREVNELLAQAGQPPRYPSAEGENQ